MDQKGKTNNDDINLDGEAQKEYSTELSNIDKSQHPPPHLVITGDHVKKSVRPPHSALI